MNKGLLLAEIQRAGFCQRSLAVALMMNKNTLNKKINAHYDFTAQEAEAICRVLGIEDGQRKAEIFLH